MRTAACLLMMTALIPGLVAADPPDLHSQHWSTGFAPTAPAFRHFAVDAIGQGRFAEDPVQAGIPAVDGCTWEGTTCRIAGQPAWQVAVDGAVLTLRATARNGAATPPFTLTFNQKANHATLLGLMKPGERRMGLPCVLHLPGMGPVRITGRGMLDYDARRWGQAPFVHIGFAATAPDGRDADYRLEAVAIHPALPGIAGNPLYDGFRRGYLDIFQVNPRIQMLANNASSDACSFTLFEYAEVAQHAPPLAEGLTCVDLVRMTLDRYLAGVKGYGQSGYGCTPGDADLVAWRTPWTSLDTLPSFLIAASICAEAPGNEAWAKACYPQLIAWCREMFAADRDGNGLIEYPGSGNYGDHPLRDRRPSNWWDCINFGHEDAFANALAYRAAVQFAPLARRLGHGDDAAWCEGRAAALKAAYAPTLLDPATGVLAGWKSANGQLHDYWFTFVQGIAITYGLLDDKAAHAVMDRLLAKLHEVGYERFDLGLPGNLIPVRKGDYVIHESAPEIHGVPLRDDGSDGFQHYENGGATACWTGYTVKALFRLGRAEDARRILHPMLRSFAVGGFHGFDAHGRSRDWRDWKGVCSGYEGLLVDNYHVLMAVFDDVGAQRP